MVIVQKTESKYCTNGNVDLMMTQDEKAEDHQTHQSHLTSGEHNCLNKSIFIIHEIEKVIEIFQSVSQSGSGPPMDRTSITAEPRSMQSWYVSL